MALENSWCCCKSSTHSMVISSLFLVILLEIVNLPCGLTHIASVLETDGVPGMAAKPNPRGPTVAPVPSPETLNHFEQIMNRGEDDTIPSFFNPAEAIRNLLRSSSSHPRLQGLKRVSQFHGNDDFLGGTASGTYYRPPPQSLQNSWDYEEGMNQEDETKQPTFVPFIGARALTNIPQFFEHLKENLEALKHGSEPSNEEEEGGHNNDDVEDFEGTLPKKDSTKLAARRMKTELLVDENGGRTQDSWSSKQNWKPRAAGIIHYYASRPNFLESQQNILRRANNYNPAWLYTNLGLGKRRR